MDDAELETVTACEGVMVADAEGVDETLALCDCDADELGLVEAEGDDEMLFELDTDGDDSCDEDLL